MTTQRTEPERLRVAYVRRAHGVHGEVRVESFGGEAARFAPGTRVTVESSGAQLTVRSARDGGDGSVLLAFAEIGDGGAAQALRGEYLTVDVRAARRLDDDEWFMWQLRGLQVRTPSGDVIGTVEEVEPSIANDVLVVRSNGDVRRFPMVRAFVKAVDVDAGVITLDAQDEVGA